MRIFKNIYFIVTLFFLGWMTFFDTNSWWFLHSQLNNEITDLERQKKHLLDEIEKDTKFLEDLEKEGTLERYARETYYMKKKEEEVFVIEYDSINK